MISYDVSYYIDEPLFEFQMVSDACTTYSCLDLSNGLCYETGSQHYIKDQQARRVIAQYKGAPETYAHKFSPFDGTKVATFCNRSYNKSHSENLQHIQVSTWGVTKSTDVVYEEYMPSPTISLPGRNQVSVTNRDLADTCVLFHRTGFVYSTYAKIELIAAADVASRGAEYAYGHGVNNCNKTG